MVDKSFIEKIEQLAISSAAAPETHVPVCLMPVGTDIHSLEPYMEGRARYRGKFATQSILDLALYASKFSGGTCFVEQQDMKAGMFFNLGDSVHPGHGDHRAELKLKRTATFTAFLQICGQQHSQKALAEWLEDWADYIVAFTSAGDAIDVKKAVAAVRRMTISAKSEVTSDQADFKGSRSAMEEIEAKSEHELPAGIRFDCTPYHGLDGRSFEARLSVITSDPPKLVLRAIRMEETEELMAQEFADKLKVALKSAGAEADVYLGSFAT